MFVPVTKDLKTLLALIFGLFLTSCSSEKSESILASQTQEVRDFLNLPEDKFAELRWEQMIPTNDWNALQSPPGYIGEITEDGFEDNIENPLSNENLTATDDYSQALQSVNVIPELNDTLSKVPGFVVPVEFDEDNILKEFFLVPYFGACFHMPPPPPNQIIHVTSVLGVKIENVYDPVWILGKLMTEVKSNDIAKAAYSMQLHSLQKYSY